MIMRDDIVVKARERRIVGGREASGKRARELSAAVRHVDLFVRGSHRNVG